VLAPILAIALGSADLVALVGRLRRGERGVLFETDLDRAPTSNKASIVILNWNGRQLLERGLPSVVAAASRGGHEVLVVDNGSDDGSLALLRNHFPTVRIIALPRNLGFAAGNNAGARAAAHDVVVMLNSDMQVEPDFIEPLVDEVVRDRCFAAASQIFLQDPEKRREETGRTRASLRHGMLQPAHVGSERDMTDVRVPVLWASGGAAAYDRRKFLALGGFDELYSPAYVEDLALSFAAWKNGWPSIMVGNSKVYHEHRATSRRVLGDRGVDLLTQRNMLLFMWRWFGWRMLVQHLLWLPACTQVLAHRFDNVAAIQVLARAAGRVPLVWWRRAFGVRPAIRTDWEVLRVGWIAEDCDELDADSAVTRGSRP
jgi:GT2 family glycosyltransferase